MLWAKRASLVSTQPAHDEVVPNGVESVAVTVVGIAIVVADATTADAVKSLGLRQITTQNQPKPLI